MSKLQMDFTLLKERLAQLEDGWTNGGFEWSDGMLVQALQAGDWLLMDNVNFCRWGAVFFMNLLNCRMCSTSQKFVHNSSPVFDWYCICKIFHLGFGI